MNKISKILHYSNMVLLICIGVFVGVFAGMVVAILAVGVDIRASINVDNSFAVLDCFVFKNIFLIKLKLIMRAGEFYLRIGNGAYRKLSYFKGDEKKVDKPTFPHLTLHNVQLRTCMGVSDSPIIATILLSGFAVIVNNLDSITHNKLRLKGYKEIIYPSYYEDTFKLACDCNIKWSFVKLIKYIYSGKTIKEGEKEYEH